MYDGELIAFREALAAPAGSMALQIIGDSTGLDSNFWVDQMLPMLAALYPAWNVHEFRWDYTTEDWTQLIVHQAAPGGDRCAHFYSSHACSVDHTAANSITGDIDIRAHLSLDNWSPADESHIAVNFPGAGGDFGWRFYIGGGQWGRPVLQWSPNGTDLITAMVADWTYWNAVKPADGADLWLRVTLDVNNGAGGSTAKFYTSSNAGYSWTQFGADVVTAGTTSIHATTGQLMLGGRGSVASVVGPMTGRLYHIEIHNGIAGPIVAPCLPELYTDHVNAGLTFLGAPVLTCVNGSYAGGHLASNFLNDATRFAKLTPNFGQVLSILNDSHNEGSPTGVTWTAMLDTMLAALRARFPSAGFGITTQNPRFSPATYVTEHAQRRLDTIGWAATNSVPVIDAYAAIVAAGMTPLETDIADGVHPTTASATIWAQTALRRILVGDRSVLDLDGLDLNDGVHYFQMPGLDVGAIEPTYDEYRSYAGTVATANVSTAHLLQVTVPLDVRAADPDDLPALIAALNAKIAGCTFASPKTLTVGAVAYSIIDSPRVRPVLDELYFAGVARLTVVLNRLP
jgi:hypothetical protein